MFLISRLAMIGISAYPEPASAVILTSISSVISFSTWIFGLIVISRPTSW